MPTCLGHVDGPMLLAAAYIKACLQDYATGPKLGQHYLSACHELEAIGWLVDGTLKEGLVADFVAQCRRRSLAWAQSRKAKRSTP